MKTNIHRLGLQSLKYKINIYIRKEKKNEKKLKITFKVSSIRNNRKCITKQKNRVHRILLHRDMNNINI